MIILVLPRYYYSGSPRCVFYEEEGLQCSPEDFRQYVPDAMDAEAWFRHHNRYANGEPIIGKGTTRSALCCGVEAQEAEEVEAEEAEE